MVGLVPGMTGQFWCSVGLAIGQWPVWGKKTGSRWCGCMAAVGRESGRLPSDRTLPPSRDQAPPNASLCYDGDMGDSADRPNRHRAAAPSAAAERMRRYRARRRAGFRAIVIGVGPADVKGPIKRGYLDRLCCDDPAAIARALGDWLDVTLAG
jgi:hypothetical protein